MPELWGGAVTAELPPNMIDASEFRQVPDNQEVYVGSWSNISAAFIVELNEHVEAHSLIEALNIHVREVVHFSGDAIPDPVMTWTEKIGKYETANLVNCIEPTKVSPGERGRDHGRTYNVFSLFTLKESLTDVMVTSTFEFDQAEKDYNDAPTPADDLVNTFIRITKTFIASFEVNDSSLFGDK